MMIERKGSIRDWLIVLLLMSAMIFSFVDRFTLSLLTEPIKRDLGLGDAQLGLLNGVAFGLFYAAMGLPFGWLADRWSRKGTIMLGIGLWSIATAACGYASSFASLLAARIGVGAGEAGLAPASYAIVHDRFPKRQLARAMSLFQVGSMVGAGFALMLAGAIYNFFLGGGGIGAPLIGGMKAWQQTFVAVAMPGALFVLAIAWMAEPRREVAAPSAAQGSRLSLRLVLGEKRRIYSALFVGMAGIITVTYALLSWIPAILGREFGWSPPDVGKSYGMIVLLFSPTGLFFGGWLADRFQSQGAADAYARVALMAAIASVPFLLLLSTAQTPFLLLAAAAGLHFLLSLPIGVVPAFIQTITAPPARGQVSALYILVVNLAGLGAGPALVGYISGQSPHDPHALRGAVVGEALPAVFISLVLLGLLVRRLRERRPGWE